MSRQIAFLESIGLVSKEADPQDGRAQSIRLTDKGEEKMHQVQDARRQVFRERLGEWPLEERPDPCRLHGPAQRDLWATASSKTKRAGPDT